MNPILIPKRRTNEEDRQEEGDLRNSKQGEEEEEYEGRGEEEEHEDEEGDSSSEEEFDKNLSLFPGLLIDSQVLLESNVLVCLLYLTQFFYLIKCNSKVCSPECKNNN